MNQLNPDKDETQFENIFGDIPPERLSKNLSEKIFLELDSPQPKRLSKKEKNYGIILSVLSIGLISFLTILFLPDAAENKSDLETIYMTIGIILILFLVVLLYFLRQLKRTNSKIERIKAK